MRLIRTSEEAGTIAVELEGRIDAVTAYDLRVTLEELPGQARHHISLDLTRVQRRRRRGDVLRWRSEHAIRSGRVLNWMGCSGPSRKRFESAGPVAMVGHRHDGVLRSDTRTLDSSRRDLATLRGDPHGVRRGVGCPSRPFGSRVRSSHLGVTGDRYLLKHLPRKGAPPCSRCR